MEEPNRVNPIDRDEEERTERVESGRDIGHSCEAGEHLHCEGTEGEQYCPHHGPETVAESLVICGYIEEGLLQDQNIEFMK